jgi:hypothetical protein
VAEEEEEEVKVRVRFDVTATHEEKFESRDRRPARKYLSVG